MRPFPTYNPTSHPPMQDPDSPPHPHPPHPEPVRRGTGTHFYLPSPATNTDAALSRVSSRHHDQYQHQHHSRRQSTAGGGGPGGGYSYSSSLSMPTSPSSSRHQLHRRSRTSLAGLRSALQTYQVPSEGESGPRTPSARYISELDLTTDPEAGRLGHGGRALDYEHSEGYRNRDTLLLRSPEGLGQEMMDALVEIHRVLYRGREDLGYAGKEQLQWDQQGQEVRRVVERWFEGDCTYDHPLAKVNSRESLLTHFILLHLISTGYLPSLAPSSLVQHAKSITSALRARLLGEGMTDLESAPSPSPPPVKAGSKDKGKEKSLAYAVGEAEWYGLDMDLPLRRGTVQEEGEERKGWWKAWDVSADCKEIGGMECYDGYHLALIEHTITLTLFPSLSSRRTSSVPSTPLTSTSYDLPTASIPPASFLTRLAQGLADEFDYLLHWDLPISTLVEFNEVGKATRVRDVIDVGDAIETFVPFAKRVGWLTRRLTGFVTSTLGAVAASLLPVPVQPQIKVASTSTGMEKRALGLGFGHFDTTSTTASTTGRPQTTRVLSDTSEPNSLGLEGVDPVVTSAPDCDADVLVQDY